MNLQRPMAMLRKELLHIARDPRSMSLALAMPVLLLLLFSFALSLDVDRIPTYVYDQDRTNESRSLIAQFTGSRYFEIVGYARSYAEIETSIGRNECLLLNTLAQVLLESQWNVDDVYTKDRARNKQKIPLNQSQIVISIFFYFFA